MFIFRVVAFDLTDCAVENAKPLATLGVWPQPPPPYDLAPQNAATRLSTAQAPRRLSDFGHGTVLGGKAHSAFPAKTRLAHALARPDGHVGSSLPELLAFVLAFARSSG